MKPIIFSIDAPSQLINKVDNTLKNYILKWPA